MGAGRAAMGWQTRYVVAAVVAAVSHSLRFYFRIMEESLEVREPMGRSKLGSSPRRCARELCVKHWNRKACARPTPEMFRAAQRSFGLIERVKLCAARQGWHV